MVAEKVSGDTESTCRSVSRAPLLDRRLPSVDALTLPYVHHPVSVLLRRSSTGPVDADAGLAAMRTDGVARTRTAASPATERRTSPRWRSLDSKAKVRIFTKTPVPPPG